MPKSPQKPLYLDATYEHRQPTQPSEPFNHASIESLPQGRRRKLGRACIFCQRSHLMCEEQRPCARCIKRGIAKECEKDHYAQQQGGKRTLKNFKILKQQDCEESTLRQKYEGKKGSITEHKPLHQHNKRLQKCTEINTSDSNIENESASSYSKMSQPISTAFSSEDWNSALFSSFFYDEDITSACQSLYDSRIEGATDPSCSDSTVFLRKADTPSSTASLKHPSISNRETMTLPEDTDSFASSNAQPADVASGFKGSLTAQQKQDRTHWFEPLTYEKGYASMLQYLKRQSWSVHNVDKVIDVLSSVRELWRTKETTMQMADIIQVQVLWATNYNLYRSYILPHTPIATIVCRKAGEIYAANEAACQLLDVPSSDLEDGQRAIYEFFTQSSSAHFFSLYEQAVFTQILSDSSGAEVTLHWNAELADTKTLTSQGCRRKVRGVFHMKFSPQNLPCLLLISLIPL